ncbi:MAG: hypothetical protein PHN44_03640 [Candidatus Marinimicrobia bacterium]|jgi:cellulose synthase/poly-beta-1,6-N-acetylglucosamine synthase-like glycosyltransferase|nr:hypothetical protein [Candidatus Neomarinimicrobiota bacterium]MDD5539309.1 hypothetical protein [Candidatus Neomarinimicrobiota bacterium]
MNTPKILIISVFRNEAHAIPHYLKSLESISYPHDLLDVIWLENDSSDTTYYLLRAGMEKLKTLKIQLIQTTILGSVAKNTEFSYTKDIPYGKERIKPWLCLWNEHFIPEISKSKCEYVLIWFGDCVAPPNVIQEYLKVYERYPDCGWVGGEMWRRHPRENECISPWLYGNRVPTEITKVPFAASHCWLGKRQYFEGVEFQYHKADMHLSLIEQFAAKGLSVYFQPSVKLRHVSTDGKIWK